MLLFYLESDLPAESGLLWQIQRHGDSCMLGRSDGELGSRGPGRGRAPGGLGRGSRHEGVDWRFAGKNRRIWGPGGPLNPPSRLPARDPVREGADYGFHGGNVVGGNDLIEAKSTPHLLHLHQNCEEVSKPILISCCGYDNFILHHIYMEIFDSDFWSIDYAARSLEKLSLSQLSSVNLWSKVSIIVTILHHTYVHTQELSIMGSTIESHERISHLMQIVGSALYVIEQDLFSKYSCTRLSWLDDKHGVDNVPVVRVDPPAVDDNVAVEVPQIQQRGPSSLSSMMDNQYLQLSTPLPQMQMPGRLLGEPPTGHQLVCIIEAFEDCSCGTFGSELSTDGRSPFGFFCSLRC